MTTDGRGRNRRLLWAFGALAAIAFEVCVPWIRLAAPRKVDHVLLSGLGLRLVMAAIFVWVVVSILMATSTRSKRHAIKPPFALMSGRQMNDLHRLLGDVPDGIPIEVTQMEWVIPADVKRLLMPGADETTWREQFGRRLLLALHVGDSEAERTALDAILAGQAGDSEVERAVLAATLLDERFAHRFVLRTRRVGTFDEDGPIVAVDFRFVGGDDEPKPVVVRVDFFAHGLPEPAALQIRLTVVHEEEPAE
jgi:hypothetical protein